jgi:hypothetical protein
MRPLPKIIISGCTFVTCCISGVQGGQSVTLAWNPDPDPNLAGYRLYCGTGRGVYTQRIEIGKATTTSVSNLAAGRTYFFAVTVYNTAYMESPPSNEVSYTVPASTRTPRPTPPPTPTPASSTPSISISVSPTNINEGGDATFTVSASTINPFQATTVHYSISGKAQYGTDYRLSGVFGQVDIPAGASSAAVVLHALTDSLMEKKAEKATMKLSKGAAYKLSSPRKATVSIADVQPTPTPSP